MRMADKQVAALPPIGGPLGWLLDSISSRLR
jgi:hypothetical protein